MSVPSSSYRPALDGVRAFAVIGVFGYHIGLPWLRGGFLGVDAFFVLSGYLITGLLLDEHARTGSVDLARFWIRRARRLLPALFVVVGVVALWTSIATPSFELELRRTDLIWTLFYGANWHFIATGQDYFAQFASASPLRHTWSLAIEEQFYLGWPLVTLVALRLARGRTGAIAAVSAVGIIGSVVAMAVLYHPGDPSRAYYGTDARIHELLVGALLAVIVRLRVRRSWRIRPTWVGGIATALVIAALVLVPDDLPAYYGGGSVAFAAGVAAMLWAIDVAPTSPVARALSVGPAVWLGRISYGIYLWHWPAVLMFPSAPAVSAVTTLGAAAMSFYLLEQPIRHGRFPGIRASRRRFVALAATSAVALVATTVWATTVPAGAPTIVMAIDGCDSNTICVRHREAAGSPVLAVVGDSIARSLDPAFMILAERHRWTYVLAAPNGCRLEDLVTSYEGVVRPADRTCANEVPRLRHELIATWHPSLVVALDRWEVIDAIAPDGHISKAGTPEHVALVERALKDVAVEYTSNDARMVFIELPPLLPNECNTLAMAEQPTCRRPVAQDDVHPPYNDAFRRIAAEVPGVATISLDDAICPGGVCVPEVRGSILRPDGLHFAPEVAPWIGDAIDAELSRAISQSKRRRSGRSASTGSQAPDGHRPIGERTMTPAPIDATRPVGTTSSAQLRWAHGATFLDSSRGSATQKCVRLSADHDAGRVHVL